MATGEFLRLHNDNFLIVDGGLDKICNLISNNRSDKPIIFFTNNPDKSFPIKINCVGFDSFISLVSYHCTWIGSFGIWKGDFNRLKNSFLKEREKRLVQVDLLARIINSSSRFVVIYNEFIFPCLEVVGKGGWNIAEVFGHNYLRIIRPNLSIDIYQKEKKKVFLEMIIPYYFNLDGKHNFKRDGFFKYLTEYWGDDYFYDAIEKLLERYLHAK
jgi:hypothetical protein